VLKKSDTFVVLLDDDPSVLKSVGHLLSSVDLHAELFTDPTQFLRYAQTHRPAVALVDVCMPQMSGLEVQSRLGEISPSTQVIIFTGGDGSNSALRRAERGSVGIPYETLRRPRAHHSGSTCACSRGLKISFPKYISDAIRIIATFRPAMSNART
jgi:DNA-binding NarL/FixJ family response regulator